MPRQIRQPDSTRLDLKHGDWLLVKTRLNAGESRRVFSRMVKTLTAGEKVALDPMQVGLSQAAEYLLDWGTFTDASGNPIVIRDKSAEQIGAILDNLTQEDYTEIIEAIQTHTKAIEEARDAEKNESDGVSKLSATSPSPSAVTGNMSGLLN